MDTLTKRETQVLALIGRGYSIPKIAEKLFRSQKTIETHRHSLGRKLGVGNRVELARIAIQQGLAPLSDVKPPRIMRSDDPRSLLADDVMASQAVRHIEGECALVVGGAYFRALVDGLISTLHVAGAAVYSMEEDEKTNLAVAMRYREKWIEGLVVPHLATPCGQVVQSGFLHCDQEVAQRFPQSAEVLPVAMHSFMGLRLDDPNSGEPIGCLMVFQDEPQPLCAEAEAVLRVCAVRATAELDRFRLVDSLQRSVETLEQQLGVKG